MHAARSSTQGSGCLSLIFKWLVAAVAVYVTAAILPGVGVDGFDRALVAALVLGLLNALLRPLMVLITLPITLLTLGLFLVVINALMIALSAYVVEGFHVDNFWWALLAAVVISLLNLIFDAFVEGFTRSS